MKIQKNISVSNDNQNDIIFRVKIKKIIFIQAIYNGQYFDYLFDFSNLTKRTLIIDCANLNQILQTGIYLQKIIIIPNCLLENNQTVFELLKSVKFFNIQCQSTYTHIYNLYFFMTTQQQPYYQQPFIRKKSLDYVAQPIVLHKLISECIHQIYFENKKLSEIELFKYITSALHQKVRPNVSSSVMYQIIMGKVEKACQKVRQLIQDSYKKLCLKKQHNNDMKHQSDSWNINFNKFRIANIQQSMNKVYGPIAHIICTYHNSLLDCNKEVYDLWKVLYQYSEIKDLEFKTLQGNLNEIVLEELMKEYPQNQFDPEEVMPMISNYEKYEFIFKEIWGFQKRKVVVHFQGSKDQDKTIQKKIGRFKFQNQLVRKAKSSQQFYDLTSEQIEKNIKKSLKTFQQQLPRRLEKPNQKLSPPKPIPLSLQEHQKLSLNKTKIKGIETGKVKGQDIFKGQQIEGLSGLQLELNLYDLQERFASLDSETRMSIFQQLYHLKRLNEQGLESDAQNSGLRELALMSQLFSNRKKLHLDEQQKDQEYFQGEQMGDIIFQNGSYGKKFLQTYAGPLEIELQDDQGDMQGEQQQNIGQADQRLNFEYKQGEENFQPENQDNNKDKNSVRKLKLYPDTQSAIEAALAQPQTLFQDYKKLMRFQQSIRNLQQIKSADEFQLHNFTQTLRKNFKNFKKPQHNQEKQSTFNANMNNQNIKQQNLKYIPKQTEKKYKQVLNQLKLMNETFNGKLQVGHNVHEDSQINLNFIHQEELDSNFNNEAEEQLPRLLPIEKSKKLQSTLVEAKQKLTKIIQKQTDLLSKQKTNTNKSSSKNYQNSNKNAQFNNGTADHNINSLNDFQLESQMDSEQKESENFYQTLKKYYQPKESHNQNKNNKNIPSSALADFISDKKTFSQTLHSLTSNNKLSSKLQKISRQQIFDQIYEVAKEKQKRGHNLKMTYKKISYELRGGDQKNQIKITEGSFTTDDLNWIEDLPQKTKYNLGQHSDFGQKLIDEPSEDICQQQKPQKKKKKKKKKKNKQKKQTSETNQNFDKGSISSFNQDQEDLQPLSEFRKKSIYDIFKLRKTLGWSEGQSVHQYLQANQILERQKQQQLLMEKKIEIYEKNGEKNQQKIAEKQKALLKEKKTKKENYTEDQLKLIQFLENLQIKDENRQKCIITEESLQKIIAKRKQIKSLEIFKKTAQKAQLINEISPKQNENQCFSEFTKEKNANSKNTKGKNKKKKK